MIEKVLLLLLPGCLAAFLHCTLSKKKNLVASAFGYIGGIDAAILLLCYIWTGTYSVIVISTVRDFVLYGFMALIFAVGFPIIMLCILRGSAEQPSSSGRNTDYGFSAVRFVATILVFFCHAFEQVGAAFGMKYLGVLGNYCSVGVPIFLMLSGYLYGLREYESTADRVKMISRIKRVLCDYWIYAFLVVLPLYSFLLPNTVTPKALLLTLLGRLSFPNLVHFWYIPYILLCYIITPFLYDLKKFILKASRESVAPYFGFSLALVCGVYLISYAYNSYFNATYTVCYVIGFFLPDWIRISKGRITLKLLLAWLMLPCVVATGLKIFLKNVKSVKLEGTREVILNFGYDFAHILLGLELFLLIYVCYHLLGRYWNGKTCAFLQFCDGLSYDFYIVHMIYVKGILSVIKVSANYGLNILFAFILSVVSAMALRQVSGFLQSMIRRQIILIRW